MRQIIIGDMRIDRLVEIASIPFEKNWLFTNAKDDVIEANRCWLDERFIEPKSGRFILSHHSYVVRTSRWSAIVDTCCGNQKWRPRTPFWNELNQPYLENLRALGVEPDEVDFVMCTHLHVDHVGWNTRLIDGRWVPTFPRARYLMGRTEYDFWKQKHDENPEQSVNHGSFEDSVLPVVACGQADFVETDHCLFDDHKATVRFSAAPGHSIGNMMIHLSDGSDQAIMSGDVIHHPIQCAAPGFANAADYDPIAALKTRIGLLERVADTSTLLLPGHFPGPTAGRVVSHADAFRFEFEK